MVEPDVAQPSNIIILYIEKYNSMMRSIDSARGVTRPCIHVAVTMCPPEDSRQSFLLKVADAQIF